MATRQTAASRADRGPQPYTKGNRSKRRSASSSSAPYASPGPAHRPLPLAGQDASWGGDGGGKAPHPGAQCPPMAGYSGQGPPTMGYSTGLSTRPDYTGQIYFKATEPLASSEGSGASALNKTNSRSETTSPRDGSLSESEARGSLSLALPRPTMAPPTPGSSSGHKRKAEEEEREEGEDRPKKKKQKKQTQTAAPRAPRTPRAATSKAPLVCPVEDCLRTSTESGGWTRHIFHTHRYEPNLAKRAKHEKELWVCACGRCFMRQRAREAHARVCARASGAVPVAAGWTWAGWDAWIEEIRRTKGASLRAEYRRAGAGAAEGEEAWMARMWDRLGVAGVLISMQTSDAARCRPRRQHVGQAKTTVRQDVQGRYAKIARLRAVGGD
ncbi:hypothetical protein OF83DRAFT_752350 [Amylostereum chailletii]|nr:hypothetical protein OF83DRAFT_752350 [Amylostereum chailletii]